MKLFIVARRARIFALNAALIVVTTVLPMLLPAFAQQEVSPTWYDPWAQNKVVLQPPAQTQTSNRKAKPRTISASSDRHQQKLRPKRSVIGERTASTRTQY
jgi:hypothetical protein